MDKTIDYLSRSTQKLSKKVESLTKTQKILLGLASTYICYRAFHSYKQYQKSVKNKVVFIIGGAKGIGRALAIRFAKKGAKVVIADTDDISSQELSNSLLSENCQVLSVNFDISSIHSIQRAANLTITHFGHPSIVINNAEQTIFRSLSNTEDFENTLKSNIFSQFYTIGAFLPHMVEVNEGNFVNVASFLGHLTSNVILNYCTSKNAIAEMNDSIRKEMKEGGKNIKFTIANFTLVDTDDEEQFGPGYNKLPIDYVADQIFKGILYEKKEIYLHYVAGEVGRGFMYENKESYIPRVLNNMSLALKNLVSTEKREDPSPTLNKYKIM